jgi:ABC-type lipoprotein release transport system permease subunit
LKDERFFSVFLFLCIVLLEIAKNENIEVEKENASIFKMTYSKRLKEFGSLLSLGMCKRELKKMIRKKAFILGTSGIVIGICLGFLFPIYSEVVILKNIYTLKYINYTLNKTYIKAHFVLCTKQNH